MALDAESVMTIHARTATVALAGFVLAGCQRQPDVDAVPVGADVQLTREDGALVEGKLAERDATTVRIDVGPATRAVPRSEIADLRVKDPSAPAIPASARFREVTIPESTALTIRLNTRVGSAVSRAEAPVNGELAKPVVVDGLQALPEGAAVLGEVTRAQASGKVKGRAALEVRFLSVSAGGETYPINARFARTAPATTTRDARTIGVPAAGGAIVGAIIGGKKGAAIGAAAGGGAGTAVVLSTRGPDIALEEGTVLALQAGRLVVVRVPIR
jgi:hypothetical protein